MPIVLPSWLESTCRKPANGRRLNRRATGSPLQSLVVRVFRRDTNAQVRTFGTTEGHPCRLPEPNAQSRVSRFGWIARREVRNSRYDDGMEDFT